MPGILGSSSPHYFNERVHPHSASVNIQAISFENDIENFQQIERKAAVQSTKSDLIRDLQSFKIECTYVLYIAVGQSRLLGN